MAKAAARSLGQVHCDGRIYAGFAPTTNLRQSRLEGVVLFPGSNKVPEFKGLVVLEQLARDTAKPITDASSRTSRSGPANRGIVPWPSVRC